MDCQSCGQKEALIHLTQIREGEAVNLWLCLDCAKTRQNAPKNNDDGLQGGNDFFAPSGSDKPVDPHRDDSLASFFGEGSIPWQNLDPNGVDTCPVCGFKLELFVRTAQLGCPACYRAFSANLKPLLSRMQGQLIHLGKVPKSNPQGPNSLAEITRTRVALEKAVAREDYEEAARLRDHLKSMQKLRSEETDSP